MRQIGRLVCVFLIALTAGSYRPAVAASVKTAIQNKTASGVLHGTLTQPAGRRKSDIVIIQPGSGASDRNGNFPGGRNNSLLLLADGLADRGIATLRFDKRAIGENRAALSNENALRFETYVADLKSWARMATNRPDIGRLFLAGHSQGALVATLAAEGLDVAGLILLAPVAVPASRLILWQTTHSSIRSTEKTKVGQILGALEKGHLYPNPPRTLYGLFRPSIQPYLISWFRYDPAAELRKLRVPTLIVHGTTDLQVPIRQATQLATAGRHVIQVNITGMNHILKDAPPDRRQNFRTYNTPDRSLTGGLITVIATFIGG